MSKQRQSSGRIGPIGRRLRLSFEIEKFAPVMLSVVVVIGVEIAFVDFTFIVAIYLCIRPNQNCKSHHRICIFIAMHSLPQGVTGLLPCSQWSVRRDHTSVHGSAHAPSYFRKFCRVTHRNTKHEFLMCPLCPTFTKEFCRKFARKILKCDETCIVLKYGILWIRKVLEYVVWTQQKQ